MKQRVRSGGPGVVPRRSASGRQAALPDRHGEFMSPRMGLAHAFGRTKWRGLPIPAGLRAPPPGEQAHRHRGDPCGGTGAMGGLVNRSQSRRFAFTPAVGCSPGCAGRSDPPAQRSTVPQSIESAWRTTASRSAPITEATWSSASLNRASSCGPCLACSTEKSTSWARAS